MSSIGKRLISVVRRIAQTGRVLSSRAKQSVSVASKRIAEAATELTMRKIVTIDFCGTDIRILETRGNRVKKWASISLGANRIESELLDDPRALSKGIREIMNSSGIKAGRVIASISSLYSVNRIVPASELQGRSLNQEEVSDLVRDGISVATDELYFFWHAIDEDSDTERVNIVGIPRDVVDTVVKSSRAAGVNTYTLDLNTMALSRLVNKDRAIILSINPTILNIIVSVDGLPVVARTVPWQYDELDPGEQVEYLTRTIRMVVSYYNERNPQAILDSTTPFFVTGQLSTNLALTQTLQADLEFSLESLTPQFEYPPHFPASEYAVNFGLALKDGSFSNNSRPSGRSFADINLLPDVFKPWRPSIRTLLYAVAFLAAAGVTYFMYQVTTDAMDRTAQLERTSNTFNTKLQLVQAELASRVPLRSAVTEYNSILALDGHFTEDVGAIYDIADDVGVQVDSVRHDGQSIVLGCTADTYTLFREYSDVLRDTGRFSLIEVPPERFPFVAEGTIKLESLMLGE